MRIVHKTGLVLLATAGALAAAGCSGSTATQQAAAQPQYRTADDCWQALVWTGSAVSKCDFSGQDFSSQDLNDSSAVGSNFTGANLSDANLSNSDFSSSLLIDANLTRANLSGTILTSTKCSTKTIWTSGKALTAPAGTAAGASFACPKS